MNNKNEKTDVCDEYPTNLRAHLITNNVCAHVNT